MRVLNFSKNLCPISLFFALVFTVLTVPVVPSSGNADEKLQDTAARSLSEDRKIHIIADKLISDNEHDYAEFIGNVRATQQDTVISHTSEGYTVPFPIPRAVSPKVVPH